MKLVADDFLWSLDFYHKGDQVLTDLALEIDADQPGLHRTLPLMQLGHLQAWIKGMTSLLEGKSLFYESDFDQAYLSVTIDPSDQDWHMQVTISSLPIQQEPKAVMGINLALLDLESDEEDQANPPGETIEIDLELNSQELKDLTEQLKQDYQALKQGGDR